MSSSPAETLSPELPVADVMRRWPGTVQVFVDRRMACPGCPMAPFMTIAEAAVSYGYETAALMNALHARLADRSG